MTTNLRTVQFPAAYIDAFGRQRMSLPTTVFDSKQLGDNQPLVWDDQQTSGGGTASAFNSNQASTTISVSNLTAGTRVRQTFRRFNYEPGKSQLVMMTGVLGAGAAGITRRAGQFDEKNGLFFELAGSTLRVVRRTYTSGVASDTPINQASWNIDKMDGTGPSGITIDTAKSQIFWIDYEWLGVGSIRFGFVVDGVLYYVHQINNANNLTLVYMSTPNLPLRYEVSNDGSGPAASLTHICSGVISEGGRQNEGLPFSADRDTTAITTNNNNSIYGIVAVRLKSTKLDSGVIITDSSIICTSTTAYRYCLLLNPTVVGTALSWVGTFPGSTSSALELAVPTNATTFTGGWQISSGYQLATSDATLQIELPGDFSLGSSIAGVSDILVLGVSRLTGTTETFYGGLSWQETN